MRSERIACDLERKAARRRGTNVHISKRNLLILAICGAIIIAGVVIVTAGGHSSAWQYGYNAGRNEMTSPGAVHYTTPPSGSYCEGLASNVQAPAAFSPQQIIDASNGFIAGCMSYDR